MPRSLRRQIAATDIFFLLYWFSTAMGLLPPSLVYDDYTNPILVAWNWSYFPIDVVFALLGLYAVHLSERGDHGKAKVLVLVALTLMHASGLMAISFWSLRQELDPLWWVPNLYLAAMPFFYIRWALGNVFEANENIVPTGTLGDPGPRDLLIRPRRARSADICSPLSRKHGSCLVQRWSSTMTFDLSAHMNTMTRTVRNLERDGKPAKAMIASCVYDTSAANLWDALTSKARMERWFLPVSGDLELGGRYQFQGNAGGTITECRPHERIGATWEFGGNVTWVTVTLTPDGQGTRLELEHAAIIDPNLPPFGPGAVGVGWELGLMGLAWHIADSATAIDPTEAAAWPTTAEGKDFVRTSSTGWGEADIAAGEDPARARAGAEMTRQFYTGEMQPPTA